MAQKVGAAENCTSDARRTAQERAAHKGERVLGLDRAARGIGAEIREGAADADEGVGQIRDPRRGVE